MQQTRKIKKTKVYFDTLGCAKNLCDTKKMISELEDYGYIIVENADDSDVIVINTCAFIETATQESIDTFFDYRNFYKDKKIVVVGCLVSRYGKDLKKALFEADGFLSCLEENMLNDLIDSFKISSNNNHCKHFCDQNVYSYVKISDGCNQNCSYCMIPKIRGKYYSTSFEEIYMDVSREVARGVHEIILVAQDCGIWGRDLNPKRNLSWLLKKLTAEFKDTTFRILYISPKYIDNELLELIANTNNVSKYLDIPLQHSNQELLLKMNRYGNYDDFLTIINTIRNRIKNCTLRTTFIVGFPGESNKQFEELCKFVQDANFDYAGCFEYSNEEGSASFNFDNQISESVKYERTNTLREILDNISLEKLHDKIGNVYPIIIEGFEEGRYYGRAPFQAPEVDGYVYISEYDTTKIIRIGDKLNVKILDTEAYDLVGQVI